jgi:hypothetical protein
MEDTNPATEVSPEQALMDALDEPAQADEPEVVASAEEEAEESAPDEVSDDQPSDDEEEVEIDGEKLKLPKKVAAAVMRQQDYTKKTQEVAEKRRSVDDRAQYLDAREQLLQMTFQEAAELHSLQKQLEQFNGIDWNALVTDEPQRALSLSLARQQLHQQLAEKQGKLNGLTANGEAARKAHLEKQQELGRAELTRRVGKMTDADKTRTLKQGADLGYSDSELATIADPRLFHALYKAAQWDAMQAAKPKAMQKVAEAPKAIKQAAPTPQRQRTNQAALERLRTNGRPQDLMSFL